MKTFGQPLFYPDSDEAKATGEVTRHGRRRSGTFTLAELRAMPKGDADAVTRPVGVKVGPLGPYTWSGGLRQGRCCCASDPEAGEARNAGSRIVLTSSDGWTATMLWRELFGTGRAGPRSTP